MKRTLSSKITVLLLAFATVFSCAAFSAFTDEALEIGVSLTVEALGETWLSEEAFVEEDATAAELIEKVFDKEKVIAEGIKQGYISSVSFDGKVLAQGDKGDNSGWMYSVNGESPSVGILDFVLSDGDSVLLYYTEDWMKEYSHGGEQTPSFSDVPADLWCFEYVEKVSKSGVMSGIDEGVFNPDGTMTRAMAAAVFYRAAGEPEVGESTFADVESGAWYEAAAAWGSENGIISGVEETKFASNQNITREQLAAIAARYAEFLGEDVSETTDLSVYSDKKDISDYAVGAFGYVVSKGIMVGKTETTLEPSAAVTRAEAAAMIVRLLEGI